MTKHLTRFEKEEIKDWIIIGKARGYNYTNILRHVNLSREKKNLEPVSHQIVLRAMRKVKKDSSKWMFELKTSKDAYIYEYKQRIDELKNQRRELYEIHLTNSHKPYIQIKCQEAIHSITRTIIELFNNLPLIASGETVPQNQEELYKMKHPHMTEQEYKDLKDKILEDNPDYVF